MSTKRIAVGIVTALALALPAGTSFAQEDPVGDPTGLLASDNVKVHTVLPEPAAVGARFRGNHMFLTSLAGLTVYDVSTPEAPVEVGRLPLPHFENEDVDLGGDILLISNDAAESYGILYVIDISNPAAPALLARHDMESTIVDGQLGNGAGHTASCILACQFAWVTNGGALRLIDLRNPVTPVNLGIWNTPIGGLAVHDVQMDENDLAWVSGFGGAAAYGIPRDYADAVTEAATAGQLTEYHNSLLVARTNAQGDSTYDNLPEDPADWPGDFLGAGDGKKHNDFILHNSRRLDGSDVVYITEEDYNRPGCRGAGSFETWRVPLEEEDENGNGVLDPTGEQMEPIDKWETELLAGTAQPAAMCSAHYFDVRQNVVAQAWYEQGLRILDVSDPADIRQIGFFITPNALSWAAYFPPTDPTGRVIYLLDATDGLVVLDYDRPVTGPLAIEDEVDDGDDGEGGDGGGTTVGGGSGDPGGDDAKAEKKKKKKKCARKKGKAKKRCKKKKKKAKGRAERAEMRAAEATEPTVEAPVRREWTTGTPAGAPSRRFGYACRIVL